MCLREKKNKAAECGGKKEKKMSIDDAAKLLGCSPADVAREAQEINPEAYATREAWIEAHQEPTRSRLYEAWHAEDMEARADIMMEVARARRND